MPHEETNVDLKMLLLENSPAEETQANEGSQRCDPPSEETEPLMLDSPTKGEEPREGEPEEGASPLVINNQELAQLLSPADRSPIELIRMEEFKDAPESLPLEMQLHRANEKNEALEEKCSILEEEITHLRSKMTKMELENRALQNFDSNYIFSLVLKKLDPRPSDDTNASPEPYGKVNGHSPNSLRKKETRRQQRETYLQELSEFIETEGRCQAETMQASALHLDDISFDRIGVEQKDELRQNLLNVINSSREGENRVSAFEGKDGPSKKKVRTNCSPFLTTRKPTTEPILKASGEYLSKLSKRQLENRGHKRSSKTSKTSVTPELPLKSTDTIEKAPKATVPKARLKLSPGGPSTISPRLQNFHSGHKKSPSVSKNLNKRFSGGGSMEESKHGPSEFDPTSVLVVKPEKSRRMRAHRKLTGEQASSRECSRNADSKLFGSSKDSLRKTGDNGSKEELSSLHSKQNSIMVQDEFEMHFDESADLLSTPAKKLLPRVEVESKSIAQ